MEMNAKLYVRGIGLRVSPDIKAQQIVSSHGGCFRYAKRQVSERIYDAVESRHTRVYWRAVLIWIQHIEKGRSIKDRRHIEQQIRESFRHIPRPVQHA